MTTPATPAAQDAVAAAPIAQAEELAQPPVAESQGPDAVASRAATSSNDRALPSIAPARADATPADANSKKSKAEPQTLVQLIEYAYSRKGQKLALKPKLEKQLAQNSRLDDAAFARLLQLAQGDAQLVVPRQILLLSEEIRNLPGLRASITSFVLNSMLHHPAFSDAEVQGALRNLPDALPPEQALAKVAAFEPAVGKGVEAPKGADIQELRHGAVRLFVTWLAITRNLSVDDLAALLFQTIWQPAATAVQDNNARLRILTDDGQDAAIGLACERFRQQVIDARRQQDRSQRETASLRERLTEAESRLAETSAALQAVQKELQALKERSHADLDALRHQQVIDKTHLQHELDQLSGRLIKRLTDSVDLLEVGLSALRKETPRVPVMVERAECVVDALRDEIRALRGG